VQQDFFSGGISSISSRDFLKASAALSVLVFSRAISYLVKTNTTHGPGLVKSLPLLRAAG